MDQLSEEDIEILERIEQGYCGECSEPEHDYCGQVDGCPCCDTGDGC